MNGSTLTADDLGIPKCLNLVNHFVERHMSAGRGAKVAFECNDTFVTFAELASKVELYASRLHALGLRPMHRAVILLPTGMEFVYAFWAIIRLGAVAIPVNHNLPLADVLALFQDASPWCVLTQRDDAAMLRAELASGGQCHVVECDSNMWRSLEGPLPEVLAVSRNDDVLWLYTSGSTGRAKACIHSSKDLLVCSELFATRTLGLTDADKLWCLSPLFFAYGLGNSIYYPLAVGATSILSPSTLHAAEVLRMIGQHEPTVLFWVPSGYEMLLAASADQPAHAKALMRSVRCAVSSGERLPTRVWEEFKHRFGVELLDNLGSTEALQTFVCNRPGRVRPGSSGVVVPGYRTKVVDEHGVEVPIGTVGHLIVTGDSLAHGYWNRPQETASTFVDGWLHTGDRYFVDSEGFHWNVGRSAETFKVMGEWVVPSEVERVLLSDDSVVECAVVAKEDRRGFVFPIAFVVPHPEAGERAVLSARLRRLVRSAVPQHMQPKWIHYLDGLPRTATGKLQRYKLLQMVHLQE